jgi:hypothetical protein
MGRLYDLRSLNNTKIGSWLNSDFGGLDITIFSPSTIEYLVVAGGGGTIDPFQYQSCGGGGAGGYRTDASFTPPASFTVTVGAGGGSYTNGNDSVLSTITSLGGGAGSYGVGLSGGSGGGGGSQPSYLGGAGTAGQGNDGGYSTFYNSTSPAAGGGGGGASAAGGNGVSGVGGAGGAGTASSITGSSVTRGGGGGGGAATSAGAGGAGGGGNGGTNTNGTAGTVNTGGGGGGYQMPTYPPTGSFAAGGSGIVIIAYPTPSKEFASIGAGLTYSVSTSSRSGYRVYTFTSGTGTVTV